MIVFYITYISIWISVYFNDAIYLVPILLFTFLFYIDKFVILPFLLSPFIFLLKTDFNNFYVIDVITLLAIIKLFFDFKLNKYLILNNSLILILIILILTINIIHTDGIKNYIILIRQYIVPLIFQLLFISYCVQNIKKNIHTTAIQLFIISTCMVVVISLFGYFGIVNLSDRIPELYPYVGYAPLTDTFSGGRNFFGFLLPRNNLYLGGSVGTNASILVCMSLVTLVVFKIRIKYFLSFICLLGGLSSQSFSILIPISLLIFYLFNYKFLKLLIFFICIAFIYNFEYFISTSLNNILDFSENLDLINLFLGIGFDSQSKFLLVNPQGYIRDIGIFLILQEFGILVFITYIAYFTTLILIIYSESFLTKKSKLFMFIFLVTVMSSVHVSVIFTSPFSYFFSSVVSYLVCMHVSKISNKK